MAILSANKPDEALLTAQLQCGHTWLRFEPELEKAFRVDYFRRGFAFRIALLLLGALLIAVTPLYDSILLHAPAEFLTQTHRLQFGIMIPVLLAAVVISLVPLTRRLSGFATMLATLVVAGGMLGQRIIGTQHDFDMPLEFAGITVTATFLVARFRFWFYLPAALTVLVAVIVVEVFIVQPQPDGWYRVIATSMLVLISAIAAYSLEYAIRAAWLHEYVLRKWSTQDPLTGLLNRRAFNTAAVRSLRQAAREQVNICVAMIDLDQFKRYNDYYGHQAGDACLRKIAEILKRNVRRPLDCCGRYGGEEFVSVWFGVSPQEVEMIARELCKQARDEGIEHKESSVADVVTLSVGIVAGLPSVGMQLETLIEQADSALYRAKIDGRDRCVTTQLQLSPDKLAAALAS